jgi:hypothetical protein
VILVGPGSRPFPPTGRTADTSITSATLFRIQAAFGESGGWCVRPTTDCGVTVPVDVQAERNNAVTNRMAFIAALFWNRLNVRASCMSSMGHEQMHRLSGSKIHQSSTSAFACSTVPRTMSSGGCDGLSGIAFRRQNPLVASIQPPVFGGSRVLPAFPHSNLMKSSHHKIRD